MISLCLLGNTESERSKIALFRKRGPHLSQILFGALGGLLLLVLFDALCPLQRAVCPDVVGAFCGFAPIAPRVGPGCPPPIQDQTTRSPKAEATTDRRATPE